MPLYLLTNKVTHARGVVSAPDEDTAKRVHMTSDFAVRGARDNGWYRRRGGHFERCEAVPPPEGWPVDLSLVHADVLAHRAERDYDANSSALGFAIAYQPSTELRHEGEGPDDTWGGYTLDRLTTHESADR